MDKHHPKSLNNIHSIASSKKTPHEKPSIMSKSNQSNMHMSYRGQSNNESIFKNKSKKETNQENQPQNPEDEVIQQNNYIDVDDNSTIKYVSIAVCGYPKVGKTTFLNKIAKKICDYENIEENIRYTEYKLLFHQYHFILHEYKISTNDIETIEQLKKYELIVVIFNRSNSGSHEVALNIAKKYGDLNLAFFENVFSDKKNQYSSVQDRDDYITHIAERCQKVNIAKYDQNRLITCFFYAAFNLLQESKQYELNISFPNTSIIKNLVATSDNKLTFILTKHSIKVLISNDTIKEYFFDENFLFSNPISLISNCDGTKLLLVTEFNIYLIDKIHSNFDIDQYITIGTKISPVPLNLSGYIAQASKQSPSLHYDKFVDIQFSPVSPNHFAIAFKNSIILYEISNRQNSDDILIQLAKYDISGNETRSNLDNAIRCFRFQPYIENNYFNIYYLDSQGLYLLNYDQNSDEKYNYDKKLKVMIWDEISRKDISSILSFDFYGNTVVFYGSIKKERPWFYQCTFKYEHLNDEEPHFSTKEVYVINDNDTTQNRDFKQYNFDFIDKGNIFSKSGHLFAKMMNELYIFAKNDGMLIMKKVISSPKIVGFGGYPIFCLVPPGFKIILGNHLYYTRMSPLFYYPHSIIQNLKIDDTLNKAIDSLQNSIKKLNQIKNEIENDVKTDDTKGEFITDDVITQEMDEIDDQTYNIQKRIEKLNHKAKAILDLLDKKQPICSNEEINFITALQIERSNV